MKVAVIKERRAHERRVAASPDTVAERMAAMGLAVVAERGAGEAAGFTDAAYAAAGATIAAVPATALADADIVLKVQPPTNSGEAEVDELDMLEAGRGADRPVAAVSQPC